jgi:hypothetical protein
MNKTLIVAAVLSAASLAQAAPASAAPDALEVLYRDTGTDSGSSVNSQNTAAAADDFTVPAGSTWTLQEVDVTGHYFNGDGPADSENVTIYKANSHGKVGKVVATYTDLAGTDDDGSFRIRIPKTRLEAGTYYVSVVINMDFFQGGEWNWENMLEVHGHPPEWEDPSGAGACQTWMLERKCFGPGAGDHYFVLRGSSY